MTVIPNSCYVIYGNDTSDKTAKLLWYSLSIMFFKSKLTDVQLYRRSLFLIAYFLFVILTAAGLPLDYLGITLWTAPLVSVIGLYIATQGLKNMRKKEYVGRRFGPTLAFISVLMMSLIIFVVTGSQIVNYFNGQSEAGQKLRKMAAAEAEQRRNNYDSYEKVKADIDACNIALVTWSRIYSFGNDNIDNRYLYIERRDWLSGVSGGSSNVWELPYTDREQLYRDIDAMNANCDKKAEWRMPQHL